MNLKECGSRAYLRHKSTRLLCLVAKYKNLILVWAPEGRFPEKDWDIGPTQCWPEDTARDGSSVVLCTDADVPSLLIKWINAKYTFAAHNALGFDAEGFDLLVSRKYDVPQPAYWYDTMPLARANGLPASLDELGKIYSSGGKHKGKDVLKLMYTAKLKGGETIYPIGTVKGWKQLLQYNVKDVLILEDVFDKCGVSSEPKVLDANTNINNRGVLYDPTFLDTLIALWDNLEKDAYAELARLTDGAITAKNIRSVPQMHKWLLSQGLCLNSLNRQLLERFYEFPEEFMPSDTADIDEHHTFLCEVLKVRQNIMRVGKAKLQRIKQLADSDNRIRNVHVYSGAHTGRWSGRGIQPHNFSRGLASLDIAGIMEAYSKGVLNTEYLRNLGQQVGDVMSTLTRLVLCAPQGKVFGIADYNAIEARCLAWLAEEEELLDVFAKDDDPYCVMASRIYGREITPKDKTERQVGKVTVLGAGYSMSPNKFAAYCKGMRIDLAAAGTTAEDCIESYRNAYGRIAGQLNERGFRHSGLWQLYNKAAMSVVERGGSRSVGRCTFYVDNGDLCIALPSQRVLRYRKAAIEPRVPHYAVLLGLPATPKPTLVYAHHHGYEGTLYGGLITENIDQATCRDLLANALVECEREGLRTVLHVHDEVVCEMEDEGLSTLCCIMSKPPEWALGFPIKVEGFTCSRYSKGPIGPTLKCTAVNGVVV